MSVACVVDAKNKLGEVPVWDVREQALYWVDIEGKLLQRLSPATGEVKRWTMPERIACFALRESGGLIVAFASGLAFYDLDSGEIEWIAKPEAHLPTNRFNEGKCDRKGRFWAGTMSMTGRRHGSLYRLDRDGRVARMVTGVTVSNGVGWSPDGTRMYYVDTLTGRIDVFDFDEHWGTITNRRPFVTVSHRAGHPDGLVVDADGCVWLALWAGGALHRYTPDGQLERTIKLPVTHPTKCAFGGEDSTDLYITSAWIELTPAEREAQPLAGGLFVCRPGVAGQPTRLFDG